MIRQPKWTEIEDAFVLDAFLKMKASGMKRSDCVQQVSSQLRAMAINHGMKIDDTFRNETGVSRQMYDLEAAWTGRPLSSAILGSKHFEQIVNLYRTDRETFDQLLQEAQKMSNIQMKGITEEDFWNWLAERVSSKQLSEFYRIAQKINNFFLPGQKSSLI